MERSVFKKIGTFCLLVLLTIHVTDMFAQKSKIPLCHILGNVNSNKKTIILAHANGQREDIEITAGRFDKKIELDTGYYQLSDHSVYLEPGFKLKMTITDSAITFNGKGEVENRLLIEIPLMIHKFLPFKGSAVSDSINTIPPADLIKLIEAYKLAARNLLNENFTSMQFRKLQEENIDYISRYYLKYYDDNYGIDRVKQARFFELADMKRKGTVKLTPLALLSAGNEMRVKKMSLAQHQIIQDMVWKDFDMNNGVLYGFSKPYRSLLNKRLAILTKSYMRQTESNKDESEYRIKLAQENIKNELIKEDITYSATTELLKLRKGDVEEIYRRYVESSTNPNNLSLIRKIFNGIQISRKLKKSPSFLFEDIVGNKVGLESFLGSYVYIDIWATWCSPCIAEFPYLNSLSDKYKNQNISFVGISIDAFEDLAKWKKVVLENKFSNKQLHGNKDSNFIKSFNVYSIPRYILIGPDGMVVSDDAPRPSSKDISEILNQLLSPK